MGAALTSHNLSDPQLQGLLREYVDHGRKTATECTLIYHGIGTSGDEQTALSPSSLNTRKPRHIDLEQFEEVFGMLVADPEPHFRFFHHGKVVSPDVPPQVDATVCIHRVFCAVAMLMHANLHSKVDFILRLYADNAEIITPEAKSWLLKDIVASVSEVLQLADSIPNSVIMSVEETFWSDGPEKLMTVQELYDICLTNSQISENLLSVHMLIEDFSASQRHEKLRQRESKDQKERMSKLRGRDSNSTRLQSITHGMSFNFSPPASLLWDLKAGDYENLWQNSELLQVQSSESCAQVLLKMSQIDAQGVLVVEFSDNTRPKACQLLGRVSNEDLLQYFLHCLVPDLHLSADKPYEHTRARAEKVIKQFGAAPLRDVVDFNLSKRTSLGGIIREDDAFFSVLLRFACGESFVVVAQNYDSDPEAVLGYLTIHDILAWLEEDLSLLKGNEYSAIAAFPKFFYAPATIDLASNSSVCEGFVRMASQKLSGILVETDVTMSILSATTFRDLFHLSFAALNKDDELGPLLQGVTKQAAVLTPACFVLPDTSIAHVIREMIDNRTKRVIIKRQDDIVVGSVRASDIVLILLQEQHTPLRLHGHYRQKGIIGDNKNLDG